MLPIDKARSAFCAQSSKLFHIRFSRCVTTCLRRLSTPLLLIFAVFASVPTSVPAQLAVCSDVTLSLNQSLSYEGKKITATLRSDGSGTIAAGTEAIVVLSIHRRTTDNLMVNVSDLFVVTPDFTHSFHPAQSSAQRWEINPTANAAPSTPQRYELQGSITTRQSGRPDIVQQIAPAEFWVHPKPSVVAVRS